MPEGRIELEGYGEIQGPLVDWSKYDVIDYDPGTIEYLTYYLALNKISAEILPTDAVILARKPAMAALLTGRRAARYVYSTSSRIQWENIMASGAGYIISTYGAEQLAVFLRDNTDYVKPLVSTPYPDMRLYAITRYPESLIHVKMRGTE